MSLKSFWHKSIATSTPWVEVTIVDGQPVVIDYNKAFIEQQREKAGVVGAGYGRTFIGASEEDLVKFFLDPQWYNKKLEEERLEAERLEAERIANEAPKLEIKLDENGKVIPERWNDAFIREQRVKLGTITDGKTDEEVVRLFLDRDSLEKEEPRLDVVHLGIEPDGKVKVQLDWNRAFIRHLKDNGITGDTEDEAVQKYLTMLTHNELQGELDPEEFYSKEQLEAAFAELDQQLEFELEDAKKQGRKPARRRTIK